MTGVYDGDTFIPYLIHEKTVPQDGFSGLFRGGDHIVHRGFHVGIGCRGTAFRRHHTGLALEALDGVLVQRIRALRDARRPCGLVAELGRAGDAGGVAGRAGRIEQGFARFVVAGHGRRRDRARGGWRARRRCRQGRGGCGGGCRCGCGLGRRLGACRRGFRLLELGARLVGHIDHGAGDFDVVEIGIAALGRHGADALHGVLDEGVVALGDAGAPGTCVASLRCTCCARAMAGDTGGVIHGLARLQHLGRVHVLERKPFLGHRAHARRDGLRTLAFGPGATQGLVGGKDHQQDDADDDDQEKTSHCDDQLLGGPDKGLVFVVRVAHDFLNTN